MYSQRFQGNCKAQQMDLARWKGRCVRKTILWMTIGEMICSQDTSLKCMKWLINRPEPITVFTHSLNREL